MGSNPTASDHNRLLYALGISRGLLLKLKDYLDKEDLKSLAVVDLIIGEVAYKEKPKK